MTSFIKQYDYFMLDALSKKEADLQAEVRRTLAQEFFDFLKTFGIIGLAIAFVIGQAASRLVTAFVNDIRSTHRIILTSRKS
jgi:hypothetical protein